jgi:hypothetical protein
MRRYIAAVDPVHRGTRAGTSGQQTVSIGLEFVEQQFEQFSLG